MRRFTVVIALIASTASFAECKKDEFNRYLAAAVRLYEALEEAQRYEEQRRLDEQRRAEEAQRIRNGTDRPEQHSFTVTPDHVEEPVAGGLKTQLREHKIVPVFPIVMAAIALAAGGTGAYF